MKYRHYSATLVFKPGLIYEKNEFSVTEKKTAAENERFIVLDDSYFTKLDKSEGLKNHPAPEIANIYHSVDDRAWGTSVCYRLYTTGTKSLSEIKKEIQKYIEKELAVFGNIDLSFIKEAA